MNAKSLHKRRALKVFLTALLLCAVGVLQSFAQSFIVNNLNYTVSSGTNVTLTGHTGSISGTLTIPSTVSYNSVTYTVTGIGDYSLWYTNITGTLVIPNTVTYIGEEAFEECEGLTSLTLGSGVQTIAWGAFYGCNGLTGTVTIPNSVTTIYNYAFYNCSNVTEFVFKATNCADVPGVTKVADAHVFEGCTGTIRIGKDVTRIPSYMFHNASFTAVTFNATNCANADWKSNRFGTASSCTVTIGNQVTQIPNNLFYWCSNITGTLSIPSAVKKIGDAAFAGTNLTGTLTIPGTVDTISSSAFCQIHNATSLVISSGVKYIGDYAFYNSNGFTGNLSIPNSVTYIGEEAFSMEDGTPFNGGSLSLGTGVQTLGWGAFYGCSGFTGNLTIPASVSKIGNYAFYKCKGFSGLVFNAVSCDTIPGCSSKDDAHVFDSIGGTLTIGTGVTSLPKWIFPGAKFTHVNYNAVNCADFDNYSKVPFKAFGSLSHATLTIGSSVQHIPANIFLAQSITGNLVIPNSVVSIGDRAFSDDDWYTSFVGGTLTLGTGLQTIGDWAFYTCRFTGNLNIPNSVTTIGQGAFCDCGLMNGTLTIGTGVTSMGNYVFSGCSSFTAIVYNATNCADISGVASSSAMGVFPSSTTATLTIGTGVTRLPKWLFHGGNFTHINYNAINCADMSWATVAFPDWYAMTSTTISIGSSVTHIPAYLFACPVPAGSLTIPNSVTSIGDYAFSDEDMWSSFTGGTLTLGSGLTSIGNWAFEGCHFSGTLTIPNTITTMGIGAFYGCNAFTGTLTLPSSLTALSSSVFAYCTGFTGNLNIPNTVTSIGASAFSGDTGFNGTLTIGTGVTSIDNNAFNNCHGFSNVVFNAINCADIYDSSEEEYVSSVSNMKVFDGIDATALTIGTGVTRLPKWIFHNANFGHINYNAISCADFVNSTVAFPDWATLSSTTISIGNSVTRIPNRIFLYPTPAGSIVIPNSVTYIGEWAFGDDWDWESFSGGTLTLGTGLTTIGESAFYGCRFTGNLTIPNSVTTIGAQAFYYCSNFNGTLSLSSGLTSIGNHAFYHCNNLTGSVTIPNAVTSIGAGTFQECSSLDGTLTIGTGVTSIGNSAFLNCSSLTAVIFNAENCAAFPVPSNWATAAYPFKNCTGALTIGDDVDTIPARMFKKNDFSGLLTIGESVKVLDTTNFKVGSYNGLCYKAINCADVTYATRPFPSITGPLTFGSHVQRIPNYMFYNTSLSTSNLALPNTLQSIGNWSFAFCNNFSGNLVIPNSVTTMGEGAFCNEDGPTTFNGTLTLSTSLTAIPNEAFDGQHFTGSLVVPNSVTSIGSWAFGACTFNGTLTLSNTLTTIGSSAFTSCSGFTGTLTIPSSVTTIANYAFNNCTGFSGLTFNAANCADIEGVTVANNNNVFNGVGGILTIGTTVTRLPKWIFPGANFTQVNYNAINCADFTTETKPFKAFGSLSGATITIGSSVVRIPNYIFCAQSPTGSLAIPNSVTAIGDFAFSDDDNYTSFIGGTLTLGTGLQSIGQYAFYTCRFVGPLTFNSAVTTIGQVAFCDCSGFTGSLILPNGLTSVEWAAFAGCSGFTGDLFIPNSVTSIGNYAFNSSSNFAGTLTIGTGVASISSTAFNNCHAFSEIIFNAANCADIEGITASSDMPIFNGVDAETLTIGTAVTRLPKWLFHNADFGHINFNATSCADMTWQTVTFPDWGSLSSTTISIANGVTRIPAYLFYCPTPAGSLTIPNSVISIGSRAFDDEDYYRSFSGGTLTMGTGVQSIGDWAFYTCRFTGTLNLPNTLTSLGEGAFCDCDLMTGTINLPPALTIINNYVFSNCSQLTGSVTISDNVTAIGYYAFNNCQGLDGTLSIGTGVTSIGNSAFLNCNHLTAVNFNAENCAAYPVPSNWATASYPFKNCTGALTIGDDVDTIPARMFKKNSFSGLLTIGESVKVLDTTNFQVGSYSGLCYKAINCADVTFTTRPFAPGYSGTSVIAGPLTFGANVQRIPAYMFAEYHNLTGTLVFPLSLQTIGDMAFYDTRFTGNCVIPNNVTTIGSSAFCDEWEMYLFAGGTLSLGTSLQTIGSYAFAGTLIEGNLVIPNSVTSLGNGAFSGCQHIDGTLTLSNQITSIGSYTFWYCRNMIGDLNIPNSVESIANYAFGYCDSMDGTITIGTGVTSIHKDAFENCHGFGDVVFNAVNCADIDGISAYGDMTIFNGVDASTLTIGTGVTRLPKWLFYNASFDHVNYNAVNCADLTWSTLAFPVWKSLASTTITIGDGVERIPACIFCNTTPAGDLTIPNSVTSIGNSAFYDDWDYASFSGGTLTLSSNLQSIGDYAFYCCQFDGELTFTNNLTTIGNSAFDDCSHLTGDLYIPNSVTSLGSAAFSGCVGLDGTLHLPEGLTTIPGSLCNYCQNLTGELVIPTGVTSIGGWAFRECRNLTGDILMPKGMTTIGNYAFQNCVGFDEDLILPCHVTSIGENAFNGCSGLQRVFSASMTPPTANANTFGNMSTSVKGYQPYGQWGTYYAAAGWSIFDNSYSELWSAYFFNGTAKDGNWSNASNWAGGIPGDYDLYTVMMDDCNMNVSDEVYDLYAVYENSLTISSGSTLNVRNTAKSKNAANIVINDGGQLIHSTAGVLATAKKDIEGINDKEDYVNWYTIASPVNAPFINEVEGLQTDVYDFYRYNEVERLWENSKNIEEHPDFTYFENGRGYIYLNSNDVTLSYAGVLNTTPATYSGVTVTPHNLPGFHLIGNPYAHNIYKGSGTAIDNAILNTGFYILQNDGWWRPCTDNSTPIAPCQGALIQAHTPASKLVISKNTSDGSGSKDKVSPDYIQFAVSNSKYEDVAYAWFDDVYGLTKIEHRNDEIPMLYIRDDNTNYAIATMGHNASAFNLNFATPTTSQYKLKVDFKGEFEYLRLIDKLTGEEIDLLTQNEYRFVGSNHDVEDRFIVRLGKEAPANDDETDGEIFAFQDGDDVVISGKGELQVFDVAGRKVMTKNVNGVESVKAPATGVYIFRLVGDTIKTQKIVLH